MLCRMVRLMYPEPAGEIMLQNQNSCVEAKPVNGVVRLSISSLVVPQIGNRIPHHRHVGQVTLALLTVAIAGKQAAAHHFLGSAFTDQVGKTRAAMCVPRALVREYSPTA